MHLATERPTLLTREGIGWRNLDARTLRIEIDVENLLDVAIPADTLVIEAAPFGAFVPWRPLTQVGVPPLVPGERRRLTADVPMGDLPEDSPVTRRPHVHWAGNLNVWFSKRPEEAVERHRIFDLVVPRGSHTLVSLFLEAGAKYSLEIHGLIPEWSASIRPWVQDSASLSAFLVELEKKGETLSAGLVKALMAVDLPEGGTLEVRAPMRPSRCHLEVHVRRETDGQVVPVEFSFAAADESATSLGCVDVG